MASAKVIKQCTEIVAANSDPFDEKLFASCYDSCTYRTDAATFPPKVTIPPETFEFLYAPFFGEVSVRQINTLKSTNGYGEMPPNFLALLLINFGTVKTTLDAGPATFMHYAQDTVLLSAMLSQKDHPITLLEAVFPDGNGSLPFTDFIDDLAGGSDDADIYCGETIVDTYAILNATCKAHPCGLIEDRRRRLDHEGDGEYGSQCCGGPGLKFLS